MTLKPGHRQVAVDALRESEANPRRITDEKLTQLARSIEADPEHLKARPLIVTAEGEILAGNMRHRAAKQAGLTRVPVFVLDGEVDEARRRQIILRDNTSAGEWDQDGLADLLIELQQMDADLDLTGFDAAEVDKLLKDHAADFDPEPAPGDGGRLDRTGSQTIVCPHCGGEVEIAKARELDPSE